MGSCRDVDGTVTQVETIGCNKWAKTEDSYHKEMWRRPVSVAVLYAGLSRDNQYIWRVHTSNESPEGVSANLEAAMCAAEDVLLGILLRAARELFRDKELREVVFARPGAGGLPAKP